MVMYLNRMYFKINFAFKYAISLFFRMITVPKLINPACLEAADLSTFKIHTYKLNLIAFVFTLNLWFSKSFK